MIKENYTKQNNINIIAKNSFVIQSSLNFKNLGQITWCSKNTEAILEIDNKIFLSYNIFQIIPQNISVVHNKMIMEYFQSGKSTIINKERVLYAYGMKKKLFSFLCFIKLFLDNNNFTNISYIKQKDMESFLITNSKGEIDCFGESFNLMTGVSFDIPFFHSHISIFIFLPQFITFFINFFTGISDLKIEVR